MKYGCKVFLAIAIVAVLAVTLGFAGQKPTPPAYDFATEVTIKGTVEEVKDFECPVSGGMGAHLMVKDKDRTWTVHLALSRFLKDYDFSFAKGDEVEVLGSKVKLGDSEAILARKIIRGNQTFTFRDKSGKPLW